ncbi:hypothetical protein SeMB42_g06927, partial [Synchytrium endobioticum]
RRDSLQYAGKKTIASTVTRWMAGLI